MKRWYAIGPVATVDDPVEGSYQCAPEGCVGWIDTRPVTGEVASGFFAFDVRPEHLKETHTIIGDGTRLDEYRPTLAERMAWENAYGYGVSSTSTLLEMLVSLLTDKADPDGVERCRPLTVNHRGEYEIHLGGHSRIYRAKFQGERDRLWPNLQRLWQAELSKTHAAEAKRGVDPDVQAGKMLCELVRLHKCPVAELTPKKLKGLKPRKPTTRLYDDFERTDLLMGVHTDPQPEDLWLATSNRNWLITDGKAWYDGYIANGLPDLRYGRVYYNAPLSSANQLIESYVENAAAFFIGMLTRCNLGSVECYGGFVRHTDTYLQRLPSGSSGSVVLFQAPVGFGEGGAGRQQITADGSTLSIYKDGELVGSATDTVLPSGGYTGMYGSANTTDITPIRCEWWSARDLLAASIPPFLLNMRAV